MRPWEHVIAAVLFVAVVSGGAWALGYAIADATATPATTMKCAQVAHYLTSGESFVCPHPEHEMWRVTDYPYVVYCQCDNK